MRDDLALIDELNDPTATVAEAERIAAARDARRRGATGHNSGLPAPPPVPGLTRTPTPGHTPAA